MTPIGEANMIPQTTQLNFCKRFIYVRSTKISLFTSLFTVSKTQTMRKRNNLTTLSSFLLQLDSTCLNYSIVLKIKKPFTFFFFKKPFFIFVNVMIVYKFGSLNFSIHPKREKVVSYIQKNVIRFFGSNIFKSFQKDFKQKKFTTASFSDF